MDERQADKIADALLAPARKPQASAREKRARHETGRARQRWVARLRLAGLRIGGAAGVAMGDGPFPAGLVGATFGRRAA